MKALLASEAQALPAADSLADLCARAEPARLTLQPARYLSPDEMAELARGAGGGPRPDWLRSPPGLTIGETTVCRAPDAWLLPAHGGVVTADGRALQASFGGALAKFRELDALPGFARAGGELTFAPPADAPRLGAVAAFMSWGAHFNYGHFLIDGLSALLALEEAGLLAGRRPVAGPLRPWHHQLLSLAFPGLAAHPLRAPVVHVEEVVYGTAMDHFLSWPNELAARVRERILAAAPRGAPGPRRLYLSRRGQPMRVMANEAALETALRRRGFAIVRPERLSVARQIALARDAEVIVAPTGAAIANALFAPRGARVIEITPENYASHWVMALCQLIGAAWRPFYCASPCPPDRIPRLRRMRSYVFGYELPLEPFLAHLDQSL